MRLFLLTICLLTILLFEACHSNPFVCNEKQDFDMLDKFDEPSIDTINLTTNSALYEYQVELYNIFNDIEPRDTIRIIEKKWRKNDYEMVRWYNNNKLIDCITYNAEEVNF